jgi:hypothetical protein
VKITVDAEDVEKMIDSYHTLYSVKRPPEDAAWAYQRLLQAIRRALPDVMCALCADGEPHTEHWWEGCTCCANGDSNKHRFHCGLWQRTLGYNYPDPPQ